MNKDDGYVKKDDLLTRQTTELGTKNINHLALTNSTTENTDE